MKKTYISLLVSAALCTVLCAASFAQVFSPDGETEPVPVQASRSVSLKQNQYLDIEYPGTGWIYLGGVEASSLLRYSGRRLEEKTTFFTLRATNEGSAILHFYKNDALAGGYIDDYLQVTVSGSSRTADHVLAPSYAAVVPPLPSFKNAAINATASSSSAAETSQPAASSDTETREPSFVAVPRSAAVTQAESPVTLNPVEDTDKAATVIQNTGSSRSSNTASNAASSSTTTAASSTTTGATAAASSGSETANSASTSSADELFTLAQKAYDEGDYEKCLSCLDDFFNKAVERMDEGLFLQAQALEAPSSSRNIKKSLAVYKSLIRQYPESASWEKAKERIAYIERLYFNIH